jgi:hypothetical protein
MVYLAVATPSARGAVMLLGLKACQEQLQVKESVQNLYESYASILKEVIRLPVF